MTLSPEQLERIAEDQRRANAEAIAKGAAENVVRQPATRASGTTNTTIKFTRKKTESAAPLSVLDFWAYMPDHRYLFTDARESWPASSINSRLPPVEMGTAKPMKPSDWLDQHRAVEQMAWIPGELLIIEDRLIADGGWIQRPGCRCFNLYRPPTIVHGDASLAGPWLDHLERIYPTEAHHILRWLAQRVQSPGVKINHALVLGGGHGIGKDSLLEPLKHAVGPWNFAEVSPSHLLGRFNGFVKSVVLRINEARDLGDVDRYSFYDHMKIYTAAPPDVLRCDEKNMREHSVLNITGVIITTNHKTDGIYLPADDRRHFVAWSSLTKEEIAPEYFRRLHGWYAAGGIQHVAAFLAELDLTGFDPKAPPPKTAAFLEIVDANRAPEDAEMADAIDKLGGPNALTLSMLADSMMVDTAFKSWLSDRRNRRQIPYRLETAGYVPCRNPNADSGLWVLAGKRQAVYAKRALSVRDAIGAAQLLQSKQ